MAFRDEDKMTKGLRITLIAVALLVLAAPSTKEMEAERWSCSDEAMEPITEEQRVVPSYI